ncbi:MAG: M23 family metallopeptidase [Clostridia bacterium]|nr:M23 family metallopeptidase [Clostridia bacterium]
MEKIISTEERIRRAEEIYQKRRNQGVRLTGNTVNISSKPDVSLFKKMVCKIIICIIIYSVFYMIKNSGDLFSQDILNKTKEVLSYDMNIKVMYDKTIDYFKGLNINFNEINENEVKKDNNENNNEEQTQNGDLQTEGETNNQDGNGQDASYTLGVGGGSEISSEETSTQEQKSQMEIDAQYVKDNYKIALPLKGTITSRFGPRTPSSIISANHAGIDIGVNEGTKIVSAMDGKVMISSSQGDYGNHIKIVSGNVTTLYAHCKTLLVKEGDEIKQGMEIAEVGQTGRATGPHLHFEIRVDDRLVNPEYILQF